MITIIFFVNLLAGCGYNVGEENLAEKRELSLHNKIYVIGEFRKSIIGKKWVNIASDIFMIDPETGHTTNLTKTRNYNELDFSLSPDGTKLLFLNAPTLGNNEIYLMDLKTNYKKRLPIKAIWIPKWLPDSKRIVFSTSVVNNQERELELYITDVENFNPVKLTNIGSFLSYGDIDCSQDGKRIVFDFSKRIDYNALKDTGHYGIIEVEIDGVKKQYVVINEIGMLDIESKKISLLGEGRSPRLFPDGKKVLYMGHLFDVYVMESDGSNKVKVADIVYGDVTLSPDGENIVFAQGEPKYFSGGGRWRKSSNIWVMKADGSYKKQLHVSNLLYVYYHSPKWSPDGKKILFIRQKNEKRELYVVNVDGSELRRLTRNNFNEKHIFWQL